MNRYLNAVLVTLGVIFLALLLIAAGAYLAFSYTGFGGGTDAKTAAGTNQTAGSNSSGAEGENTATTFTMSEAQRQAIASFGIDPASVPTNITADQEACFVAKLGQQRVEEIKTGAVPSAMDFFKVKSCI